MVVSLVVALVVAGAAGCGGGADPYEGLSVEELRYVIPPSGGWGSGSVCGDAADCSGALEVAGVQRLDWFEIVAVTATEPGDGTITVELVTGSTDAAVDGSDKQITVRAWEPDVDAVSSVLDDGYEVWVGVDDDSALDLRGSDGFALVFAGFDTQGRTAGIGFGAAENFTIPIVRSAVSAGEETARSHFVELTSR